MLLILYFCVFFNIVSNVIFCRNILRLILIKNQGPIRRFNKYIIQLHMFESSSTCKRLCCKKPLKSRLLRFKVYGKYGGS